MRYPEEVYFKTAKEMRKLFNKVPGACDNTLQIAERCNVTLHLDASSIAKYPQFEAPGGEDRNVYFKRICQEGLIWRYGEKRAREDSELQERLDYEISIMEKMGFLSYFLIVWDFIKWARDHQIPVGPGRGSAAGSLVAYALGITNLCPIRFTLIFERFLNPERVIPTRTGRAPHLQFEGRHPRAGGGEDAPPRHQRDVHRPAQGFRAGIDVVQDDRRRHQESGQPGLRHARGGQQGDPQSRQAP